MLQNLAVDELKASPHSPTQVIHAPGQRPTLVLRSAEVRVVKGPDRGLGCPMELRRVHVGSAPDNNLVLSDPGVSRHHLEFLVTDQGFLVRDLGSTNGTFYRGARVQQVLLSLGAEVRLASTVLRLERGPERSDVIEGRAGSGALIGSSPAMQEVFGLVAAVAPTDVTVLLEGETGTGKELVAQELHRQSPRSAAPLWVIDCGVITAGLIESELFGHEKGAFTGADVAREGAFEKARGGTVFIDEIGELRLELQTRLLRVLDRRTIKRVGSQLERKVDARVVAATNRDLRREVRAGRFREDLYFRLAGVTIRVPPLRERLEDVPLLARHFLWQTGCADPDQVLVPELLDHLASRKWPGNVRELRNVMERAAILADGAPHELQNAPLLDAGSEAEAQRPLDAGGWLAHVLPAGYLTRPFLDGRESLLDQYEEVYFTRLVEQHGLNISQIAREAGIDRKLVRKLLKKHRLG